MFDLCVKCKFVPNYVQRLFDFKGKLRGCLIDEAKLSREHAERHADEVRFKVFPYTCVEMSGGLIDIASCTACTRKYHAIKWYDKVIIKH